MGGLPNLNVICFQIDVQNAVNDPTLFWEGLVALYVVYRNSIPSTQTKQFPMMYSFY